YKPDKIPRLEGQDNPFEYRGDGVLCLHLSLCLKQVPTLQGVIFQWRKRCPRGGAFVIAFERHATIPWMDDQKVIWSHLAGKFGGDEVHVSHPAFHRGQLKEKGRRNG